MYSNPAAAGGGVVQTFNPAASEPSSTHQLPPVHSLPANNQQYYSLPAHSIAPGAPASAAQMTGYGQQYNVAGGAGYQPAPPQTVTPGAPAGYQQTPTQMYMPGPASQAQPGSEYQPYNMHGMISLVL